MSKRFLIVTFLLFLLLVVAACGGAGDPAKVVEQYLQAKVAADEQGVRSLLCAAKEAEAFQEVNAFTSVSGAHIEGLKCQRVADSNVVTCQGKIVALYGTESTEFPLASYQVVQEDGEWKWCGEAAR
jgi:hypothetical protein